MYTTSNDAPTQVNAALSDPDVFSRLDVPALISKVASLLNRITLKHADESDDAGLDSVDEASESDHEEFYDDEDDDNFGLSAPSRQAPTIQNRKASLPTMNDLECARRIRTDLRKAKEAGFRVAGFGDSAEFGDNIYVLLSCRVAKLGIADDVMKAWNLERHEYIMLLLHYSEGYKPLELLTKSQPTGTQGVRFHVGLTQKHKIDLRTAIDVFSAHDNSSGKRRSEPDKDGLSLGQNAKPMIRSLFIGPPMVELLNGRLIHIVCYRQKLGLSWKGAEEFLNDFQGRNLGSEDIIEDRYYDADESRFHENLPQFAKADELNTSAEGKSFPLVAMQFTLRHIVRCTEFCLVCHRRVETDFEALKPFVCSNPLCLYQYMSLGFGPSIEYEILTQPYVVDLLISFAYASAASIAMRELPIGMSLLVPSPQKILGFKKGVAYAGLSRYADPNKAPPKSDKDTSSSVRVIWNKNIAEAVYPTDATPPALGAWLVLCFSPTDVEHRRVIEVEYFPKVRFGPPVKCDKLQEENADESNHRRLSITYSRSVPTTQSVKKPETPPASKTSDDTSTRPAAPYEADIIAYDQLFDDLDKNTQQDAIRLLLDTLPTVLEMKSYLQAVGAKRMTLKGWTDRINPAALGLLRWIIASNRSCIVQIDNFEGCKASGEERVAGMGSYLQFRFALGAPDKEQRFIQSVRDATQKSDLKYPTLFAWHGSPLCNWHGIIREGLNFEKALHGRAFGDGVYMSKDARTSMGYMGNYNYNPLGTWSTTWASSLLKISSALCLNEVVNAPSEFVSTNPHLVVKQVDWIQTRYLFVTGGDTNPNEADAPEKEVYPAEALDQDPKMTPNGKGGRSLVIPASAISKARRPAIISVKNGQKKAKVVAKSSREVTAGDHLSSDESDAEDIALWRSPPPSPRRRALTPPPKTDFVPGTLDFATLPILATPSYASPLATKNLQRALKELLKTQTTTPPHELGWALDAEQISNMYQWIVELHSFDLALPLAKDLRSRSLSSVVLELRFGPEFPFSPPFVRVIRPRFLSFLAGGGGHVTSGGALCMELLTNSGWNAASSIEAVLLQVHLAISSTDPKPARLEKGSSQEYGVGEAVEAYRRACNMHGWTIPKDFAQMTAAENGAPSEGFTGAVAEEGPRRTLGRPIQPAPSGFH